LAKEEVEAEEESTVPREASAENLTYLLVVTAAVRARLRIPSLQKALKEVRVALRTRTAQMTSGDPILPTEQDNTHKLLAWYLLSLLWLITL
jgi:hypothetical protein